MSKWNCYLVHIVAMNDRTKDLHIYKIAGFMDTALQEAEGELKEFLRIDNNYSYGYRIDSIRYMGEASL